MSQKGEKLDRNSILITISWLIWGAGFYVYYPFYSILVAKYIGENNLGQFFTYLEIISLPFPILGALLFRKIGEKNTIILGMLLSGLGIFIIPYAKSYFDLLFASVISYLFYISLPNYYSLMKNKESGTLTKIWAISVLPAVIFPILGGSSAQVISLKIPFILGGLLTCASGFVIFPINDKVERGSFKISIKKDPTPFLSIIPIALVTPFLMPELVRVYHMNYFLIGLIDSLLETLGMISGFFLPRVNKLGLPISLLIFSLISFFYFYWPFSLVFGMREAIIPLSLDYWSSPKSPEGISLINTMQLLGWVVGYGISWILKAPKNSIVFSSIFSFALGLYLIFIILLEKKNGNRIMN